MSGGKWKIAVLVVGVLAIVWVLVSWDTNEPIGASSPPPTIDAASVIIVNDIAVKISGVEERVLADTKLVTIHTTIKNSADKAQSIYGSDLFKLTSGSTQYSMDIVRSSITHIGVNPGIEKSGDVTFEIPKDATDYKLAVMSGPSEVYAYYDIK